MPTLLWRLSRVGRIGGSVYSIAHDKRRKSLKKDINSGLFSMNYAEVTWKEKEPGRLLHSISIYSEMFLIVMKSSRSILCSKSTQNSDIHIRQDSQGSQGSQDFVSCMLSDPKGDDVL